MPDIIYIPFPYKNENESLYNERLKLRNKMMEQGWDYTGSMVLSDMMGTKTELWVMSKKEA